MQLSNIPGKLVLPFANAGGKSTIPVASQIGITAGAASLTDGFPPLTRTPIAAGGVPPSGLDMNGILYEMSAIIRWANAGGGYPFDGTFAADTNVGGYPKGARIMRSDGQGYWFNTTDNNVTDPNDAGAVAAGWVPDFSTGVTAVTMTGSSVTLTPLQYGKRVIAITGALTANLNLIFPNIADNWVILNGTTGGYTITAKTAAGTGAPLGAVTPIFGDGNSIYAANSDSVQVVGSVAKLRTIAPNASRIMKTSGYYVAGDNGDGTYCARTGAAAGTYVDNGGTVIVPTGGDGSAAWILFQTTPVTVRQFGAKGDWNGTTGADDTAPIQACYSYCHIGKQKMAAPAGRYKLTASLVKSPSFFHPDIVGDGYGVTSFEAVGFTSETPIFYVTGGSGGLTGAVVSGIRLTSNNQLAAAAEIDGQCGLIYRDCQFDNLKIGMLPHNKSSGNFTEFVIAEDCDFTENCIEPLVYRRTGGNDSFHGTGLRNCTIGEATTATIPKIRIGGTGSSSNDIIVYNAPLSFQVWKNTTQPVIANNTTRTDTNFNGNITMELFTGATGSVWNFCTGANTYLLGNVSSLNDKARRGMLILCNTFETRSDGVVNTTLIPYPVTPTSMVSGANNIVALGVITNETYLVRVQFLDDASPARKVYLLCVNFEAESGQSTVTTIATLLDYFGGAMPVPAFSVSGNTLVATAAFATTVTSSVTVTKIGISSAFNF